MTFNESRSVEGFVRDRLCGGITHLTAATPGVVGRKGHVCGLGWRFLAPRHLARLPHEVMVEGHVREALIRLNPAIAAQPDRAEDVLHRLRSILMAVRKDGLVNANEEFTAWLRGNRSMPFAEGGEHAAIDLIDFSDLERNQYVVTTKFIYRRGASEKRADLVLLVNGIPLIVIEAVTPATASRSWSDAAVEIHYDERNVRELFVPNVISIATDGKELRYGSIGLPVERWGPWHTDASAATPALPPIGRAIESMLRPNVVLDLLANFSAYTTDEQEHRIKIVARHEEYEATNAIVERVVMGHPNKGLIWHSEGLGTSMVTLFAARQLLRHPKLTNPTALIVVGLLDLDRHVSSAFCTAFTPTPVLAHSRAELQRLLAQDTRAVVIATTVTFAEADGVLNDRTNIVAMVDEAHRTQECGLGRKIREALPNAFLFGMTGRPINCVDRNTLDTFSAADDKGGFMNRYAFEE